MASTRTEVSANPSTNAVTVAASGKELEADVQRKMKLWGVIEAFRDGRMPDNQQIDAALEYAIEHSPVDVKRLSPEGKVLIDDSRDILETLRMMVREKNADELFQNAVYASYHADPTVAKQEGVVPVSKDEAKADVDQAAAHLRVLLTLFITNSETRKLVKDLGFIGRDMFATAASKAAEKARPTDEQLNQVDREAESKTWIGADGQKHGTQETPELQLKDAQGREVRYNPKDAPSDAKITDADGNVRSAGEAYDQGKQAYNEAQQQKEDLKQQAKDTATSHASDLNNSRDPNASASQQKDQVLGAAQSKANDAQGAADNSNIPSQGEAKDQAKQTGQQIKEKIPDSVKENASQLVDTTKNIVKESFPEERREQFIFRLKKVLVDCQEHKDYREAMEWLLDSLSTYTGHAQHVAAKADDARQDLQSEGNVAKATDQFQTLLERFANGRSMQPIFTALDQIYSDVQQDPELKKWFTRVNEYAHQCLLDTGYVLEDEADREGRAIYEDGKAFFQERYRGHWEKLSDEIETWTLAMGDDPLNKRLGEDFKRLYKDLLFDDNGNLTLKPKLWNDIRLVILPEIIKRIGYIPIPRAEYDDDKISLVIENLILSGPNLFPNLITLRSDNSFTFSPYSNITKHVDTHHHLFELKFSQVQADIRDTAFAFRRKRGWPLKSDHGLLDVVISGNGISGEIVLESVENRRDSLVKLKHCNISIDKLDFKIRDSKHDFLYKLVRATANNLIKKAITVAVQAAIKEAVSNLDDQLVSIRTSMDEAKKSDETTRTQALKDLYARKKEEAEQKSQQTKDSTGTFRIVTDRDSQLNPDLTHDSRKSISQRLYKVEDAAHSGKKWKSPAFGLTDSKHPAATGQHHPQAEKGAAAGNSLSSAIKAPDLIDGNQGVKNQGVNASRA